MDEESVRKVIADNNQGLLVQIQDLVKSSISDLKRSNETIASHQMSEIKRLKRDPVHHFNKKSNEEQFNANKAIKDAVEDAQTALDNKDLQKTKEALDKGMDLLKERQKLILLADKSPYGWKTVVEYKHHDLADDEEDEKKIYRAESRAARSTKRFASRSAQQRRFVTPVTAATPQLSASQLPNLFSRVRPQSLSQRSSSGGRLRRALNFWKDIRAPKFILDVIEFGYKLPLLQIPTPFVAKNNSSALDESPFVESAINELISQGCVAEVFQAPVIINPLSVSIQKSGKKRLILDLRHVNQFLYKIKFRCEDLTVAKEVLNPGDFMFSFDLKSGYHHVEIFPEHRQFLSFAWTFSSGCTRYFEFTVLPFGLSSAPFLFTKLLKPLVKKWRSESKAIIVFLDDGLGAAADESKAKIASLQVHADLFKSGFLPNEAKCVWEPTQIITWLGTVLNTATSEISATEKRVTSLQQDLSSLLATSSICLPVRKLASVCGKIISLGNCVGNVSRLMSRNLFAVINSAPSWNASVYLSSDALAELNFWSSNVASLNGIPMWPVSSKPSKIVYSDASGSACASFIDFEGKIFHQNWSDFEKAQSSTYRELLAVSLSLKAFNESLKAQTVTWFTDNQNVVRIVNSGSKVHLLQDLAMDIYQSCLLNAINIDVQWIPRDLNSAADDVSKFIDYDDYTINDEVFHALDELWGPHSCDRFACSYNAKIPLFNSRFYQPGSSGVNAFVTLHGKTYFNDISLNGQKLTSN
ncbi:hypothetical protein ACROYT_G021206 [Oculina patagonica]